MQCTKVLNVADRRGILKNNQLCCNCAGTGHTAGNCKSKSCVKCGQRHHTSLSEKQIKTFPEQATEKSMSASNVESSTIHGKVKAKVDGHAVRIMIDTGVSRSVQIWLPSYQHSQDTRRRDVFSRCMRL